MSPFLRGKTYWSRLSLRDGARHRLSLRTTDADSATRLERMLATLADQHHWIVLDAVHSGAVTLGECWDAYSRNAIPKLERSIADGTRTLDLEPFVALWAEAMARKGRPSKPLQTKYLMQVRRLIPSGAVFPSEGFTTPALSVWLQGLKNVTQPNRYQAALSRFARFLIERGILASNPLASVERAKESDPKIVSLYPEDVDRLLASVPDRDRPMHALMAATGVEWQAVTLALAGDIDLDKLTFRAKGTKTHARDRVVSINRGPALAILRAYWRKAGLMPTAPLFPKAAHGAVLRRLKDACDACRVQRIGIHDWRHVYAVQAVRDGMPYHLIANQLGHTNTIMVQRVYGRFRPDLRDLGVTNPDTAILDAKNTTADTPSNSREA